MPNKYSSLEIAQRLQQHAQGEIYDENTVRVAKDLPCLDDADRSILDAFLTGINLRDPDEYRMRLQDVAIKIRNS